MKSIRLVQMEKLILERKMITIEELQEAFDISKNTVRRDINELLKGGNIKKVYGGVESISSNSKLMDFSQRNIKEKTYKNIIGKVSAKYIQDNDIIFIDSGTTTVHLADYLQDKKNVTIITNNIDVITKVVRMSNINLIGLGGRLNRMTYSFVGKETIGFLQNLNINKAFMAATGLTIKNGATNSLYDENEIKSEVVKKAEEIYLLIDHTKFDTNTLLTYCEFSDIDYIITDKSTDEYKKEAKKQGVKLIECL